MIQFNCPPQKSNSDLWELFHNQPTSTKICIVAYIRKLKEKRKIERYLCQLMKIKYLKHTLYSIGNMFPILFSDPYLVVMVIWYKSWYTFNSLACLLCIELVNKDLQMAWKWI